MPLATALSPPALSRSVSDDCARTWSGSRLLASDMVLSAPWPAGVAGADARARVLAESGQAVLQYWAEVAPFQAARAQHPRAVPSWLVVLVGPRHARQLPGVRP